MRGIPAQSATRVGDTAAQALTVEIEHRLAAADWTRIAESLGERGYATIPALLKPAERPLPPVVVALRAAVYRRLAPIANRWARATGRGEPYPAELARFLEICRGAGQTRPTPLLLRYEAGGYNCLHQDLYGEVAFPIQLTCLLSRPGADFGGGEFLLVENRPRAQSRGEAIALEQGEAILFATNERPIAGRRGYYRLTMRHGVSRVRHGRRFSLGVIFHDAK